MAAALVGLFICSITTDILRLSALSENLCERCIFLAAYQSSLKIDEAKCTFLAR
jgi:hypothetical protein